MDDMIIKEMDIKFTNDDDIMINFYICIYECSCYISFKSLPYCLTENVSVYLSVLLSIIFIYIYGFKGIIWHQLLVV